MEIYNGVLCISGAELIQSPQNPAGIMPAGTYKSLSYRNQLRVMRRGCWDTPALIAVDSLPGKYRHLIADNRNAQKLAPQNTTPDTGYNIEIDYTAEAFFQGYINPQTGKHLPEKSIYEYTNGAQVLNSIIARYGERVAARRRMGASIKNVRSEEIERYLKHASTIAGQYPNQLPISRRIIETLSAYLPGWDKGGAGVKNYAALIKNYHQNLNRNKIIGDAAEWIIARYGSVVNRLTLAQLHKEYNAICGQYDWKEIKSITTLKNYLNQPEIKPLWAAMRYGELKTKDMQVRQHRTLLPTLRDTLWYSDGTKLNYYYRDEQGRVQTCNVYEVIDSYSEVLLGFHISKSEDYEAQYFAYKMAVERAQHRPYEIKYDNQGGHKKLAAANFLNRLAKISTNTAPYNGRSKTIENIFYRLQKDHLHKDWFFTGQNITAKKQESRANMEFVLANKNELPTLEQVRAIYSIRREEWNNAPHPKTNRPRIEMYRESVNANSPALTLEQYVDIFWLEADKESKYTASGIEIQVKKQRYAYEVKTSEGLPDMEFLRKNAGRGFVVKYDPSDMSIIQLCERTSLGLRVIAYAEPYQTIHRAAMDQTPGERQFIALMDAEAKEARRRNQSAAEALLERWNMHPAQHGLRVPKIAGIGNAEPGERTRYNKRKTTPVQPEQTYGQYQKAVSNMCLSDLLS